MYKAASHSCIIVRCVCVCIVRCGFICIKSLGSFSMWALSWHAVVLQCDSAIYAPVDAFHPHVASLFFSQHSRRHCVPLSLEIPFCYRDGTFPRPPTHLGCPLYSGSTIVSTHAHTHTHIHTHICTRAHMHTLTYTHTRFLFLALVFYSACLSCPFGSMFLCSHSLCASSYRPSTH